MSGKPGGKSESKSAGTFVRALAATLLLVGVGCAPSGGAVPFKDPAKGEFYTMEELEGLRGAQLDRYCQYMERALRDTKAETTLLTARRDSLEKASEDFRTQSTELSSRLVKLQNEVRELRLKEKALTSYVVRPGDTLKTIAAKALNDESRWREIFELNKGALGKEDAELRIGSRLNMPRGQGGGTKPGGSKS